MDRGNGKNGKVLISENIIVCIGFLITAILFCMNCFPNPLKNIEPHCDANVFRTVAYQMKQGYMPYRDTFDHKGPIIYFINIIGMTISYYRGIWVIEVVNLFVTLFAMYKAARIFSGKCMAYMAVILSMVPMTEFFEGGDFVQEFAMPFIAIALYIFVDYFINERISSLRLILCGISFAVVFMLQPNMIALWMVFCVAVLIECVKKKDYKSLGRFLVFFVIGALLIMAPIVIWLLSNNAFSDFIDAIFKFNKLYSSAASGRGLLYKKAGAFFRFITVPMVATSVMLSILFYLKKSKYFYGIYTIQLLVNIILISIGGSQYGHYGLILIPILVVPIAEFLNIVWEKIEKTDVTGIGVCIVILAFFIAKPWCAIINSLSYSIECSQDDYTSDDVKNVVNIVNNESDENDLITVFGNWDIIHVLTKRMPASKYSYQNPIAFVDDNIMQEYMSDIEKNQPKLVVVEKNRIEQGIKPFIENNNYELIWASDDSDIEHSTLVYKKR